MLDKETRRGPNIEGINHPLYNGHTASYSRIKNIQ